MQITFNPMTPETAKILSQEFSCEFFSWDCQKFVARIFLRILSQEFSQHFQP